MIFGKDSDGADTLLIRQSWWGTHIECNERGRLAILHPDDDISGDAAACGTATHAAIEDCINGVIGPEDMKARAEEAAHRLLDTEPIRFLTFDTIDEMVEMAGLCAEAWGRDMWPTLPKGGRTEVKFEVHDLFRVEGVKVGITGTADYVLPDRIMDWKTSGKRYDHKKVQKFYHQPTIYSLAAAEGGFGGSYSFPMEFTYGVVVRNKRPVVQQLTVVRTEEHVDWLLHRMETMVRNYLRVGLDTPWNMTDTGFLCSDRWCPWYDKCRGAHVSWQSDKAGL